MIDRTYAVNLWEYLTAAARSRSTHFHTDPDMVLSKLSEAAAVGGQELVLLPTEDGWILHLSSCHDRHVTGSWQWAILIPKGGSKPKLVNPGTGLPGTITGRLACTCSGAETGADHADWCPCATLDALDALGAEVTWQLLVDARDFLRSLESAGMESGEGTELLERLRRATERCDR